VLLELLESLLELLEPELFDDDLDEEFSLFELLPEELLPLELLPLFELLPDESLLREPEVDCSEYLDCGLYVLD